MWILSRKTFDIHPVLRCCLAVALASVVVAPPVAARDLALEERRPELPDFSPPAPVEPDSFLPAIPVPEPESPSAVYGERRLEIARVEVRGATAVPAREIDALTRRYVGRPIGFGDIQQLRDEITRLYVSRGYVNSGAVVPPQERLGAGVLEIEVVEGRLAAVEVRNENGRLRDRYVESRIASALSPVNVAELDARLQVLQRDPRIRSVKARLQPTAERGLARLELDVIEERALTMQLIASNDVSPTIGAEHARLRIAHDNLTGWGDSLRLGLGVTEGLDEVDVSYDVPLSRRDATLGVFFRGSRSDLIDRTFEELGIESRSATYGVRARQPLFRSPNQDLSFFASGEYRRSKSFLVGSGFSFSRGVEDGVTRLAVARGGLDYTLVREGYVLALRSTASFGIDALDATRGGGRLGNGDELPEARFRTWLAQAQLAVRTGLLGIQAIVRTDLQLSDTPLFGLEQFAVGGSGTVRGYRENELVGDQGLVASAELRIPLPLPTEQLSLDLAPFFDIGRSWNRDRSDLDVRTLSSAGLGLHLRLQDRLRLEAYWAQAFERDIPEGIDEDDWQDDGVHVRAVVEF